MSMNIVEDGGVRHRRSMIAQVSASLAIQIRVVGAIMLRELHTRFGRNNVGYLWLVLEPMILSGGVSIFHVVMHVSLPYGFSPATFYSSGYIAYIVFRNNVNRATGLVESNKPLLFHKNVTLLDLTIARVLLDVVATTGAMILILSFYVLLGVAPTPERPWLILGGLGLMSCLAFGVSAMVAGACEFSPIVERFVHPATYLVLPLSGMFSVMDELPRSFAIVSSWLPLAHIADLVRMGLVRNFNSTYLSVSYVVGWCAVTSLLGMILLRIARRRMHFD